MTVRITPIKGKGPITEPAIRSQIEITKFAEIVYVQLKQVYPGSLPAPVQRR